MDARRAGRDRAGRWLPGTSGNPNGRPVRRATIIDEIARLLEEEHNGKTLARIVAEVLVRNAVRGDVRAIRELIDRLHGKAVQPVAGLGPDGSVRPVTIEVVVAPQHPAPVDAPPRQT